MVKDVQPKLVNDEQQSLGALKQYGGYIVSAIMLVLAGYFGWSYWQKHGGNIDTAAANDFAKIQSDLFDRRQDDQVIRVDHLR